MPDMTIPSRREAIAAYLKEVERTVKTTPCHWRCGDNLRFPSNLDAGEKVVATEAWERSWPAHAAATELLVRRFERFCATEKRAEK